MCRHQSRIQLFRRIPPWSSLPFYSNSSPCTRLYYSMSICLPPLHALFSLSLLSLLRGPVSRGFPRVLLSESKQKRRLIRVTSGVAELSMGGTTGDGRQRNGKPAVRGFAASISLLEWNRGLVGNPERERMCKGSYTYMRSFFFFFFFRDLRPSRRPCFLSVRVECCSCRFPPVRWLICSLMASRFERCSFLQLGFRYKG